MLLDKMGILPTWAVTHPPAKKAGRVGPPRDDS